MRCVHACALQEIQPRRYHISCRDDETFLWLALVPSETFGGSCPARSKDRLGQVLRRAFIAGLGGGLNDRAADFLNAFVGCLPEQVNTLSGGPAILPATACSS